MKILSLGEITVSKVFLYCGGPIQNCTHHEIHGWREELKRLVPSNFVVVDPSDRVVSDYSKLTSRERRELVERDLDDIFNCDALVFNAWRPSFGSPQEIVYGHLNRIPVVTVYPCVDVNQASPWLTYHSDRIVTSVAAAVEFLKEKFGSE